MRPMGLGSLDLGSHAVYGADSDRGQWVITPPPPPKLKGFNNLEQYLYLKVKMILKL